MLMYIKKCFSTTVLVNKTKNGLNSEEKKNRLFSIRKNQKKNLKNRNPTIDKGTCGARRS